jgi:predicted 3-demethylubiquinone-9 3-methyltransferase (glyoxalase superfamily)
MKKITPFLWFNDEAEAAADFYCSVFSGAKKLGELRFGEAGPGPAGSLLVVDLELEGQQITLMNGGPGHPLTDAFSLVVRCETQAEIDGYWAKLTEGGAEGRCGWLKDKFGLSWQIIPVGLTTWLRKPAAMQAMLGMTKLEIAVLEAAAGVS